MNVPAAIILSLVLLAEAMISQFISGSALHLVLIASACLIFGLFRFFGPVVARIAAFTLAMGISASAWQLFERGLVPISLSDLPLLFHLAIGLHFFAWTLAIRGLAVHAGLPLITSILSATVVAWTAGTIEIYGTSELLVRSLGFGVLAACAILGLASTRHMAAHSANPPFSHPGRASKMAAAGVGIALIGVILVASVVNPAHRVAGRLYTWFGIDDDATQLEQFGSGSPTIQSGSPLGDGAGRDLPRKAEISLNPRPRFFLEVADPDSFSRLTETPVYVRTSTLSVFEGDGRIAPLRSGEWRYDSDDGNSDGQIRLTGGPPDQAATIGYSVLIDRQDSRALPMIVRTQSIGLDSIYSFADDWYQFALEEHQERVRFDASAAMKTIRGLITSGRKLEIGTAPADYTRLPTTPLAGSIQLETGRLAGEKGRALNNLLPGVREWLGKRCAYSLSYENPENRPAVDNFLFGEGKGHCELFAASTVMMLRSLGIPSRIAYGYCGGVANPARRLLAFRESDFHAWAEIFLDDFGWVVFETTPSGEGAFRVPRPRPASPAFANFDPAAFEELGEIGPIEPGRLSGLSRFIRSATDFVTDWFFAICAGIAALGALAFWMRPGKRSEEEWDGSSHGTGSASGRTDRLPEFLNDFLRTFSALGLAKRPGQTFFEFLESAKSAGACGGEFDDLARYLYAIRYAGHERNREQEKGFRSLVKKFGERCSENQSGA